MSKYSMTEIGHGASVSRIYGTQRDRLVEYGTQRDRLVEYGSFLSPKFRRNRGRLQLSSFRSMKVALICLYFSSVCMGRSLAVR